MSEVKVKIEAFGKTWQPAAAQPSYGYQNKVGDTWSLWPLDGRRLFQVVRVYEGVGDVQVQNSDGSMETWGPYLFNIATKLESVAETFEEAGRRWRVVDPQPPRDKLREHKLGDAWRMLPGYSYAGHVCLAVEVKEWGVKLQSVDDERRTIVLGPHVQNVAELVVEVQQPLFTAIPLGQFQLGSDFDPGAPLDPNRKERKKPLEDRLLRVRVTKRDIARGLRRNACACPVAIATSRAVKARFRRWDGVFTRVDAGFVTVRRSKGAKGVKILKVIDIPMTDQQKKFIVHFDQGQEVEPFEFEVEVELKDLS